MQPYGHEKKTSLDESFEEILDRKLAECLTGGVISCG
jgi:hypothetical protein